ncbi:hypothetical protein [Bordetella muralis]|uniref:hypothetical protein n=1 Tax=Bordetella muralis TaxID=1649130 RepID=UPI0039EFF466
MIKKVLDLVTGWKGYLVAGAIGAVLVSLGVLAWSWRWSSGYDAGHAAALAEVKAQQAAIERGMQVEKDRADAQHRGAVLARQLAEQKAQTLELELTAVNTRIDGLLRQHRNRTPTAGAVRGPDAAGPDWIGILGECLARAESLSRRLGEVGADAAGWADQVNGLQGYVRSITAFQGPARFSRH